MKNLLFLLFASLSMALIFSCEKDDDKKEKPTISLIADSVSVIKDTAIAEGVKIKFHIQANANGGDNLTNLIATSNDTTTLINYGFNNQTLDYSFEVIKNSAASENIVITIRNSGGLSSSISIKLTKNGTAFNPIQHYSNIILGGQTNANLGSFFSLGSGQIYLQSDAFLNQSSIDMLYYYNVTDKNCLASPGASIAGIFLGASSPDNWTTKNTTYYGKTILSISDIDFDSSQNDSLILANKFTDSGRKAKPLAAGQVYSFQAQNGKYGLVKIIEVNGMESGTLKVNIQVQK